MFTKRPDIEPKIGEEEKEPDPQIEKILKAFQIAFPDERHRLMLVANLFACSNELCIHFMKYKDRIPVSNYIRYNITLVGSFYLNFIRIMKNIDNPNFEPKKHQVHIQEHVENFQGSDEELQRFAFAIKHVYDDAKAQGLIKE